MARLEDDLRFLPGAKLDDRDFALGDHCPVGARERPRPAAVHHGAAAELADLRDPAPDSDPLHAEAITAGRHVRVERLAAKMSTAGAEMTTPTAMPATSRRILFKPFHLRVGLVRRRSGLD